MRSKKAETSSLGSRRSASDRWFEDQAELLVAFQLDLLAQIERQLRCIHHTMRHIERLRSARDRIGPELTQKQRGSELDKLSREIDALLNQLDTQQDVFGAMQKTVAEMQAILGAINAPANEADLSR